MKGKKLIALIISIVALVLIITGVFLKHSDKKLETKLVSITSENQEIEYNNKKIKVKLVEETEQIVDEIYNYKIYINDEVASAIEFSHLEAIVTEKYILIGWPGGQCKGHVIVGAINEDGQYIAVDTDEFVSVFDIKYVDNVLLAKGTLSTDEEFCGKEVSVDLIYNKTYMLIRQTKN